ncbi:hypothetical protein Bca4012_016606 [Brassica carinata]
MDSDSGDDDDGVGCGGGGGGIGAGGTIGAGGSQNKKGLNPYKHVAADKRKERLPPQDDLRPQPLRVFADGSRLLFDWRQTHPALLCHVFCQLTDICWALVLGGILQFVYNKDRGDTKQYKELDVEGFANNVKLADKRFQPLKKVGASSMAVGSLKNAMAHMRSEGIEKKKDTERKKPKALVSKRKNEKPKTYMLKGSFLPVKGAIPKTITNLVEAKGPLGLTLDFISPLIDLADGIYRVPKPIDGLKRHVVTILAHGLTLGGEIFFEVQNSWGTDWGVNGHGRIIISGSTDDVFFLDEIFDQKKNK